MVGEIMEFAEKELVEKKASIELKKHVNAVHCTNNLSLLQRKLFNVLLHNAYPDLKRKQRFSIKTSELCFLIGYNSNDVTRLKSAILDLVSLVIEWNVLSLDGQEKAWKASSSLASVEIIQGTCIYEYSHLMKELFFQPDIYAKLNMEIVSKFKSSYGLALYENCIRYYGLSQTQWFPIPIFRKLMGVMNDDIYSIFRDFKRRVIDIAVHEVNTYANITIEPQFERVSQRVTKIRFLIENKESVAAVASVKPEDYDLIIKKFGLSETVWNALLSQYPVDYLMEKAKMIMASHSYQTGKIKVIAGYYVEALKKDFKSFSHAKTAVSTPSALLLQTKKMALDAHKEEIQKQEVKKMVEDKVEKYIDTLLPEEGKKLFDDFDIFMSQQAHYFFQFYEKSFLEHPAIKSLFNDFVMKRIEREKDIA